MKRFIIRYGLIGSGVSIALGLFNWFFIAKPLGYGASQFFGYLSIVIALLCIPFGIMYFKNKLNHGRVSFNQGFKIGLGISAVTSIVMFFYGTLFFVIAGDDFVEWTKSGLTGHELQQMQQQMETMPAYMANPWFQGFTFGLMVFLIGMIINIISSFVLKHPDKRALAD